MAPELLENEKKIKISGQQADIWSLGVTFYAFTFLKVPFYGANVFELLENIKEKKLEFPEERKITEGLKSLLEKMITKNPEERAHLMYNYILFLYFCLIYHCKINKLFFSIEISLKSLG